MRDVRSLKARAFRLDRQGVRRIPAYHGRLDKRVDCKPSTYRVYRRRKRGDRKAFRCDRLDKRIRRT